MSDYVELRLDFDVFGDFPQSKKNITDFLNSAFGQKHFGLVPEDVLSSKDPLRLYTGFGARTWPEVYNDFITNSDLYGYKLYQQVHIWQKVD